MKLDHIVHFTDKSPSESLQFWKGCGFHAVIGGSHKDWGTHNALMYGADYYVEWLTVEDEEVAKRSKHPLVEQLRYDRRGFGTICLRSGNLEELAQRLEERGFKTDGVVDASRTTETGDLIRWKMLFIKQDISAALPLPFFIEWQESDEVRLAGLKRKGAIQAVNEQLQLDKLVFSVNNREASEAQWQQLLGGSLKLENCRLEFQQSAGTERLSEVRFADAGRQVVFEQASYRVPRFE